MRRLTVYITILLTLAISLAGAVMPSPVSRPEDVRSLPDTLARVDTVATNDHPAILDREPLLSDSLSRRTAVSRINREDADIDGTVTFAAADSIVFFNRNRAYMYGESTVDYGEFKLNAGSIEMELDSNTVYATGVLDSLGKMDGAPVFKDKSGEYESRTMKYNFRTQRGYITDVVTQQGEGYLNAGRTKKMDDGTYYVEDGKYTTCQNPDHPHFYFKLTRARVTPKKNIVTGPAYLVVADVPLPLALPFGFFPFSKDYSSGVIFPSFGDDYNRGFYLRDGGYYFAINDNIDLALRGEIYTKGSWGIGARSNYVKRYKFRGSFDIDYLTTILGDKGSPDYSKSNNFKIAWTHTQDAKANPNLAFSAAVNFTTSGYTRNDLNSYYSSAFTENTKSSTVNMTYRFPGTKWSISTTANVSQRTQDSTLSVSFPNVTLTLSQLAPFKRKIVKGGEKWYEKIRLSYTGQFQNSLTARQNEFFKKNLVRDWRNGMSHSVPVQATFTAFKYFNITPSLKFNDRMYFEKVRRAWDTQASAEVRDTTYGFYNIFDFSASVGVTTKVYGFWKPMKFLGDKIQMIRHVLTPSVSLSYSPDFGSPFWGIYDVYYRPGTNDELTQVNYSYFTNQLFGVPSRGKTGMVGWSLSNNLEMKVKSDKDSTGVKKISLIENFTVAQSYNMAADSLRFSNISTSILLRLVKGFNLNLNATWDPYTYALGPSGNPVRVDKLRINHGKGLAKLSSTGTSFSYTFSNSTFQRKKSDKTSDGHPDGPTGGDDDDIDGLSGDNDEDFAETARKKREERNKKQADTADADGYAAWKCPWSLTFNYSVNYGYGAFDYDKLEYKGKWTQNLSISGNIRPTDNWTFSLGASYNFDLHRINYMNCNISRDLHCFTLTASFIPVGPYKSYNFHIAVKSSLLKDLKYDKRSSYRDGLKWY